MKLRSALLVATVLAAPMAANAQAVNGLYIGAGAGANFMHEESLKSIGYPNLGIGQVNLQNSGFGNTRARLDVGFVGVASVGYGFGNGLRLEVEGGYRQNKFSALKNTNNGVTSSNARAGGDEMKYSGMLNVLYDFDLTPSGVPLMPYVGVGAGYSWAQHKNARFSGNGGPVAGFPGGINQLYRTNQGDGAFAYQAILGLAFPIGSIPGLALTAEYRFQGLLGERTYNYQYFATGPVAGGITTRAKLKFDDDFNHSVMLGIRYAFNAAPPPVTPMPAPQPVGTITRTYLVFFDWDRADLTTRARQIINEAAQATTKVAVTRIEVAGHTDKSGTPRYNQGLSQRRAANVASELVRLGVPRSAITTQAFGESRPLVNTADGVREPQNRRVEIVLR